MSPELPSLPEYLLQRAEVPRQAWTADRVGRLIAGMGFLLVGALAQWNPIDAPWLWWALALGMGAQIIMSTLVGWCPFHQMLRRAGVKEREEVFVQELRSQLHTSVPDRELAQSRKVEV